MASPCPCRGCKAAYEAGLADQKWAEHAYEQGYDSGWKHGYDEGRVLGYAEGKESMRKYLLADDENTYTQGHRDGGDK